MYRRLASASLANARFRFSCVRVPFNVATASPHNSRPPSVVRTRIVLHHVRHQGRPSCLMTSSEAAAVVAVKVLEEQEEVAPMWIVLQNLACPVHRPAPILAPQKDRHQAM